MSRALTIRKPSAGKAMVPGYAPPVWAWLKRTAYQDQGSRVDWFTLYNTFIAGWYDVPEERRPSIRHFGQALKHVCECASIRIEIEGQNVYCLDIQLAEPAKAIAPPREG